MKALFSLAALACGVGLVGGTGVEGGPRPAGRDDAKSLKVSIHRTLGVGDFEGFHDLTVDDKSLTAEEARDLRKMVQDAHFFTLTSSPKPPPIVPDPSAGYDLKVEMDGKEHAIWVKDGDIGESLKPLVEWLTARARRAKGAEACGPDQPAVEKAVKVEFTKSGGEAGLFWSAKLDSATLRAEDARRLRKLLADARFLELPEKLTDSHGRDLFGYTIVVEVDGKRHSVEVYDDTMPEGLRPLTDWLAERATLDRPAGR
jgi:hypothetical protein